MEINYMVIVYVVTYMLGAFTKSFIDAIPNKYIPIQNTIIGVISALICYYAGVEANLLEALILCCMASFGAGGTADLVKVGEE